MDESEYIKLLKRIQEDLGYLKLGGYLNKQDMINVIEEILGNITEKLRS